MFYKRKLINNDSEVRLERNKEICLKKRQKLLLREWNSRLIRYNEINWVNRCKYLTWENPKASCHSRDDCHVGPDAKSQEDLLRGFMSAWVPQFGCRHFWYVHCGDGLGDTKAQACKEPARKHETILTENTVSLRKGFGSKGKQLY